MRKSNALRMYLALFHNSLLFTWVQNFPNLWGTIFTRLDWLKLLGIPLAIPCFKFGFGVNITACFVKVWEDDILVWLIRQLYQQILNYHIWLVGVCQYMLVQPIFLKNVQQNHESAVNKSQQYLAFQVTNIGDRSKGRVSGVLHV